MSNLKCFACGVWILTTIIPALSNESQKYLEYGFPPKSLAGKDSIRSGEYRIFAKAVFT
jgi:hypothetical protein